MDLSIDFEVPTWNQIYEMLQTQAKKIKKSNFQPEIIIAIACGGLVPARILMDLLEIKNFAVIQIEYYEGINRPGKEPVLKQGLNVKIAGKKTLLVDDVSDLGKSLQLAKNYLQKQEVAEIKTATIYVKPKTSVVPDFFEKLTSSWIVFPWDAKENLRKIQTQNPSERDVNQQLTKLVKAGFPEQLVEKLSTDS